MNTAPVGDVAPMAGITARTLHHYDEVGSLVPSERRPNGYRAHTEADIDWLQRITASFDAAIESETKGTIMTPHLGLVL